MNLKMPLMNGKFSYANVPADECFSAADKITMESNNLWKSSHDIAKGKNYGYAVSTMILSLEELMKAVVLTFDGYGFEFRQVKGMSSFFYNHNLRHLTVFVMFGFGLFGDEIKKYGPLLKENPTAIKDFIIKLIKNDPETERKVKRYLLNKLVLMRREFKWFRKMESIRQSGVYSDYTGELELPSQWTEDEYRHAKERLEKARQACLIMIDAIKEPAESAKGELEKLRINFKKENRYEYFADQIALLRKNRFDAFDAVEKGIKKDFA